MILCMFLGHKPDWFSLSEKYAYTIMENLDEETKTRYSVVPCSRCHTLFATTEISPVGRTIKAPAIKVWNGGPTVP